MGRLRLDRPARVVDRPMLCVVAHASTADAPEPVVGSWWREFALVVRRFHRPDDLLIGMVDADTRVVAVTSCAVGDHAAEKETFGGACLREWPLQAGMRLPTAFAGCLAAGGLQWTGRSRTAGAIALTSWPLRRGRCRRPAAQPFDGRSQQT